MDEYRCFIAFDAAMTQGEPLDGRVSVRDRWEQGSFAVNAKPPGERVGCRIGCLQRETAGRRGRLPSM